jgi:hypothetical protein
MRQILAPMAGLVFGSLVVAAVEWLGHAAYPSLALDPHDVAAMRAAMARLPVGVFLFVLLSWWLGAFAGVAVAIRLAGRRPRLHAAIVGGVLLAAVVANLATAPHPTWVAILGPVGVLAAAVVAVAVFGRRPMR